MPPLTLTVNGRPWSGDVPEGAALLDVLRERLALTGTKYGCGEGRCGSCTVIANGRAVRSCQARAGSVRTVVTIEGLAEDGQLHPVQRAFLDAEAFQCGFCTPGMIVGATALLTRNSAPSDDQIRQALDGHLCRCGTYPRIIEAVKAASAAMTAAGRRG